MISSWKARLKLMRRRWHERWPWAAAMAVFAAACFTAAQWSGWRGVRGWQSPGPLREVWWQFPILSALIFLALVLNPWRNRGE